MTVDWILELYKFDFVIIRMSSGYQTFNNCLYIHHIFTPLSIVAVTSIMDGMLELFVHFDMLASYAFFTQLCIC